MNDDPAIACRDNINQTCCDVLTHESGALPLTLMGNQNSVLLDSCWQKFHHQLIDLLIFYCSQISPRGGGEVPLMS